MKTLKNIAFPILIWLANINCFSQDDSSVVLSYNSFIEIVKENHPIARQGQLQLELGDAYLLKAKGNFDPKIEGGIRQKYYQDDQYYNVMNAGLKIPTWYGLSVNTGYDLNSGIQLNPESKVPETGLWYAGLDLALGRGMFIDQRRAELQKAKIYIESSAQYQRKMLNELILESSAAYWAWFEAYHTKKVYEMAIINAQQRFENVKSFALLGDKPSIDTLEAHTQLQTRLLKYLDAQLKFQNATSLLEIYLWKQGFIPLELSETVVPEEMTEIVFSNTEPELLLQFDSIRANHPELLLSQFEIEQKKVDLKLSRENLKPTLNLKYNAISGSENGNPINSYSINNYVWGADISIPVFLRKERGDLRISKIQLENLEADLAFKSERVAYKIENAFNYWSTSFQQLQIWQNTTQNFYQLFESEQQLFNSGESSLFMVNSREMAYLSATLTQIELIVTNQNAEIKSKYAMGILHQNQ